MLSQAWKTELQDLIRGLSGGFLFGIPLMYTMEVWWIGSYTNPPLMLSVLAVTFLVLLLLNQTDGFRKNNSNSFMQMVRDSVEALALGLLSAAAILFLLQEVTLETPLDETLGKIIFEAVPFSLGVALARTLISGGDENDSESEDEKPQLSGRERKKQRYQATLADIGATAIGALFIAFNIAPTDEIPTLASAASAPWLLGVIASSLVISYGIVFVADFTTQQKRLQQEGLFQHPLVETVMSYLISLVLAALMLWFFHRLSVTDPWQIWLRHTILLGLPATVGGAAGRIAI
ncbi:TIGR02587 family membrane protein [Aphanothece hegewaldii CCALA 016]|uniref:TIGR02587 family membrane protein n=1 Tax=Aphanothece hegewaldii CCALA 016 TaxID=2107694 RepID=A0A2T1M1Y2_9CHRO|nr:TIGR02587 family membrane protein [Aphanothece hegewaldii]PSF38726.1 TIGR02587 family membrane protein [Aphanothece hegewaldii CCALA 016]